MKNKYKCITPDAIDEIRRAQYNIPEQPYKIPMPPAPKKPTDGLRPCIVTGQKAYFHCWEQFKNMLSSGREVSHILGIIEHEDGTIHKCYPDEIQFTDREEKR